MDLNKKVGGSNTHLTDRFDIKSSNRLNVIDKDKSFVIDWISFTFDNVMYEEDYNRNTLKNEYFLSYSKTNDYILNGLLKIFNINKSWESIETENYALNGYKFSWLLGEHIKVNFAGPRSGRELPTTQILMNGQACREFEKYYGGRYFVLFDFLTKNHEELNNRKFNGHFKRLDIAVDDFTGKEIDIYDLKEYADEKHWVGSYQSCTFYYSNVYRGGISSKGYSITFGSPGSNQLQIYDKKLEQQSKNKNYIESDIWYRYEMRFTDPSADKVVEFYQMNYINRTLNIFAFELLKSCIDFKIKSNAKNKSELDTLPEWDNFCNHVKKIDLKQDLPSENSFEKKQIWFEKNLSTSITQLLVLYGDEFVDYIINIAENGTMKISEKQILQIERFIASKGKSPLSEKLINRLKMKGLRLNYDDIVSK